MNIDDLLSATQITVLIGKNGSGKSTLLRRLDQRQDLETRYISPERGGSLKYDPNVDNNIATNDRWMAETRRKNRFEKFREQSAAQFRNLETAILREIEQNEAKRRDFSYTFETTLASINALLPAIRFARADKGFGVVTLTGEPLDLDSISSGESELIALAIEALVFSREKRPNKILLLDEPDVHLHPDLQHRFAGFLVALVNECNFKLVVATHSTAILSALSESGDVQIVPIHERGQTDFQSFTPDAIAKQLLPVFGVHPLANHFNSLPILLVEGEDDRRVIEQVVRSSQGSFIYSPAVVGAVQDMNEWEVWLDQFLPAIYDEPMAFSLRDLDDAEDAELADLKYVRRARLNCYAIENLLLTDDCLTAHGYDTHRFPEAIRSWVTVQPTHQGARALVELLDHFDERRIRKIKDIRNILCALLGTSKPWEVVVGQLLAVWDRAPCSDEHSLYNYLGKGCVDKIFR